MFFKESSGNLTTNKIIINESSLSSKPNSSVFFPASQDVPGIFTDSYIQAVNNVFLCFMFKLDSFYHLVMYSHFYPVEDED